MNVAEAAPELAAKVSSYRAGFLADERRDIERGLASGSVAGVISTSALEMGIDIGGLDVCILVGYPGTVINTWQRSGRVGRGGRDSLVILIAQPDALDQYYMRNPHDFFQRSFEAAVVDPDNSEVLDAHLPCAAAEIPLQKRYIAIPVLAVRPGINLTEIVRGESGNAQSVPLPIFCQRQDRIKAVCRFLYHTGGMCMAIDCNALAHIGGAFSEPRISEGHEARFPHRIRVVTQGTEHLEYTAGLVEQVGYRTRFPPGDGHLVPIGIGDLQIEVFAFGILIAVQRL